jgi:hypothetical protein
MSFSISILQSFPVVSEFLLPAKVVDIVTTFSNQTTGYFFGVHIESNQGSKLVSLLFVEIASD